MPGFVRRSVAGIIAAPAVACIWLPSLSCRPPEPANDTIADTRTDSAGIEIVTNSETAWAGSPVWRVGDEPRTVIGSNRYDPGHALLLALSAIMLPDGRILVANRGTNEIRVFDADGRFLTSFGGEGPGPGEFRRLLDVLRFGPDSIVVSEDFGRAQVFDINGRFGRQVRIGLAPSDGSFVRVPRVVGVFDGGELLVSPFPRWPPHKFVGVFRDTIDLTVLDPQGALVTRLGRFLGRAMYRIEDERRLVDFPVAMPYPAETFIRAAGSHLYVADNARYEIQIRSPEGALQRVIRKAYRQRRVSAEAMRDYREYQTAYLATAGAGSHQQTFLAALADVLPMIKRPDVFPAMRDLLVDTEGCVWVREYVPTSSETDWTVFGPDGAIIGRAMLPEALTVWDDVYEIGPDYVLGRVIGDDNVEFIHLYTLERTSTG